MFGFDALQALVASMEAGAGGIGGEVGFELASEQGLGFAEAFGERDLAGANVIAAAAFDAVEQAVARELIAVERLQIPVQLLRQQECRAREGAIAAANAGHLGTARL